MSMFKYELPIGGFETGTYFDFDGKIKFDPPVYEQRYATIIQILEDPRWSAQLKSVVDFGCAELSMVQLLRRCPNIERILAVDIDKELLRTYQQRAVPLISDHLQKRAAPLRIEVLKGSIDAAVDNLRQLDVVLGIEIIEHLYEDTLQGVPENVFGFIQPKLAIFTTPNCEFNVLFNPLLPNGFRHLDHKFEWSRAEFKKWALDICRKYPNYSVSLMGVGKPPPDHKKVGYVTQIGIFVRNDLLDKPLVQTIVEKPADNSVEVQYEQIYAVDYPFYVDERSVEQKIMDEAKYIIDTNRKYEKYFNRERCIYQIPLRFLLKFAQNLNVSEKELREILQRNDIETENEFIVLPEDYGQPDEDDDIYDDLYRDFNNELDNIIDNDGSEENWD